MRNIVLVLFVCGAGHVTDASAQERAEGPPALVRAVQLFVAPERAGIGDQFMKDMLRMDTMQLAGDRYRVQLSHGQWAELTLRPDVQRTAMDVLARAQATKAAIVVATTDGALVALAGRTLESPNLDVSLATTVWAPAASVFKIVTTAALLSVGVHPTTKVCYHGGFRSVTPSNLHDNPRRDRACDTLAGALARSQNAIIAKLAHRHLNTALLKKFAALFGFGNAPTFALSAEAPRATIPDSDFERARVAAGFWQTELSPIGGAMLAATVATGGMRVTPRIVHALEKSDGTLSEVTPLPPSRVLDKRVANTLRSMLGATVARGGTAYKGFHDRRGRPFLGTVTVAGKTGTLAQKQPSYLEYSWFVGYAPVDNPKYVIAVLLGNPPKWHLKAHTAARLVLQQVFAGIPVASR